MRIIRKQELANTDGQVRTAAYETTRFLLASDDAGATVTDIVLAPGIEETYGYERHTEIAYCLEGEAELTDLGTGNIHAILPGTMWVAHAGERFRFRAAQPTRLVCVFTPPLRGDETGFAADMVAAGDGVPSDG